MSPGSSSPETRVVSHEELAALAHRWEALAAAPAEPNPFFEPWALLPSPQLESLVCATVWIDGSLCAVAPLERVPRYRGLPLRALRSWRNRHLLLGTPLVRRGTEAACLEALRRWARAHASVLELDYLPSDGPLRAALGPDWKTSTFFERAILRRAASAEEYLKAALDGNTRRELKRKERRLKEAGRAEYVRLQAGGDIARWIADFLRLEASGWKGEKGTALACREVDRRYAEQVFRGAFERGRLLATGVDLDGVAIAREMCLVGGEGAFSFRIAYDEAYGRYAPGLLGELETVRAFHDWPGLQWLDSFTGEENVTIGKLWKGRRRIERIAVGTDAAGRAALAALQALRKMKKGTTGSSPLLSTATIRRSLHGVWVRRTW